MKKRSQSITFLGKAARLAFEAITGTKLPASKPTPHEPVNVAAPNQQKRGFILNSTPKDSP